MSEDTIDRRKMQANSVGHREPPYSAVAVADAFVKTWHIIQDKF
jgi:hypothetical protein